MRIATRLSLLIILAFGVWAYPGCGSREGDAGDGASSSGAAGVGFMVGQAAPDFSLDRVAGGRLDLKELRGKTVLVDFWDTWCPPCRRALPHLEELSREHSRDFVVVGVSLGQEGSAKVKAYVEKGGFTFPFVFGDADVFQKFGVQNLPTTFLLDADGVIRKKWVGGYPRGAYEQEILKLLDS